MIPVITIQVDHTDDCGTHAINEPCCQGYIDWMEAFERIAEAIETWVGWQ